MEESRAKHWLGRLALINGKRCEKTHERLHAGPAYSLNTWSFHFYCYSLFHEQMGNETVSLSRMVGAKGGSLLKDHSRLVDLQYCLGRWFDIFLLNKELDPKVREELVEESSQAREYLTKAAAAGAYIVSDETAVALEELLRKLDRRHPNVVEEIDTHYAAVKECIARIREYAEKDMHKR